jgi:two-component system chemotaxis response regulator CheY
MTRQLSLLDLATLVVEPSAMQSKLLSHELAKAGIARVNTVRNGGEALAHLRTNPTSLVVSAFHLPDMTGAELIGAIRADPALAEVPFILVSSESRHTLLDPVRRNWKRRCARYSIFSMSTAVWMKPVSTWMPCA